MSFSRPVFARFAALTAGLLLAGCASLPQGALPPRDALESFTVDGRFALKSRLPDGTPDSTGGRLSWTHRPDSDRILLASPLGIGLAEIDSNSQGARLRTGDGKVLESADADQLVAEVTGQPLPVRQLPGWLLGRPGSPAGRLERDPQGRPQRLAEAGWQIDYTYDNDDPAALPARLTLLRPPTVDLRLRIESWLPLP